MAVMVDLEDGSVAVVASAKRGAKDFACRIPYQGSQGHGSVDEPRKGVEVGQLVVRIQLEYGATARAGMAARQRPAKAGSAVEVPLRVLDEVANLGVGAVGTVEPVNHGINALPANFVDGAVIRRDGPVQDAVGGAVHGSVGVENNAGRGPLTVGSSGEGVENGVRLGGRGLGRKGEQSDEQGHRNLGIQSVHEEFSWEKRFGRWSRVSRSGIPQEENQGGL